MRRTALCTTILAVAWFAGSCGGKHISKGQAGANHEAVLVGAGDIADCKDLAGAEATAKLLEKFAGR